MQINASDGFKAVCRIKPNAGELIMPNNISLNEFNSQQQKLGGMQERDAKCNVTLDIKSVMQRIINVLNIAIIMQDDHVLKFAGKLLSGNDLILVETSLDNNNVCKIKVNCSNFMFSGHIIDIIKNNLK